MYMNRLIKQGEICEDKKEKQKYVKYTNKTKNLYIP